MKKNVLLFSLLLTCVNAHADWKNESINGLQTYFYTPKSTSTNKRALMINLHGCAQKAEDLKKDGNWEPTADEYNMIVALPKVPNGGVYSGCWDYYGADHTRSNRHNGPVLDLVKNLLSRTELNIDPAQVYVSGLSSGGGESMVLGCMAPDVFAGMGLNAGPSTGTTANEIGRPQTSVEKMLSVCKTLGGNNTEYFKTQLTSIIYGSNDFIVNPVHDTNNAQIMSTVYSASQKSTFDTKKLEGSMTDGTGTMLSDSTGPRISLIMNSNLGHNWPAGQGGNAGNFISKKSINYPAYLAKFFFENNRRSKNVVMPELLVNPVENANSKFLISGAVTIPTNKVKSITVSVTKKSYRSEEVDRFELPINSNGEFSGSTKSLNAGEYNFSVILTNTNGMMKQFFRPGWLGDVPGVMSPQVVNVSFESMDDCLTLKGQALSNGGDKLKSVMIELDRVEAGSAEVGATTEWKFKKCGLSEGKHSVGVYALNESDLKSVIQDYQFDVRAGAATSTLQAHMEAGRLPWIDYGIWYAKYGNHSFTLYKEADGSWSDKH
jgi:poly(3-hydroxybutyrate) depolymerase